MKFIPFFIPLVAIGLSVSSCGKKIFGVKGKGNNVLQSRSVSGFNNIHLSIDADVYYVQDSYYSLEISAQPNILSEIETEVEDNELEIEFDDRVFSHSKITITIHAPDINALSVSGSGKIIAQTPIVSSSMKLKISGSGDINLAALTAPYLDANISGSGNMTVSGGTLDNEDLNISGSGDINVQHVVAQNASARISGSGNITVQATQHLNATISGSGDIKYVGNPTMNVNISGSGKVVQL